MASKLYGGLVAPEDLPARLRRDMKTFQLDPGTIKVDWALDGPVPWATTPPYAARLKKPARRWARTWPR